MGTREHKQGAPLRVKLAVISVSSTRTLAEDKSGHWIVKRGKKEKHEVVDHRVVPDEPEAILTAVHEGITEHGAQAILLTGGTGIAEKDITIETLRPLFDKELMAFSALFAQLSFEEIDSAALLSRACAGVYQKTVIFCMPGSLNACRLACKALIFPELPHLVKHVQE
ncbi:MAG: MogA/MoaB family molybdenum cofactor biosynthesis protein [Deltaproteobacteria bacterium]|nr:MogA/MoaB family molybdenum cofactor biosynthesis protein [Deltaproteobacteria bacterium]MBW1954658.1 MogA/MoaB family molybdenum cofactor biosynthesis protein [Deltaproteobacteria bacterium]MBW2040510.1 MogA/MoaB family molybdenum cofactor biosynthesis protein [Deltaproteobacteria bacterium]MBW2131378.1 MogA/MoaB family molybdenum cofactor biosynthesis protein [Deltaproteobacteria bacterium]